jgi:ketosteroid isomerase-like protein
MKLRARTPYEVADVYTACFNAGDLTNLLRLYEANAVLLTDDGVVQGDGLAKAHQASIALGVPINITGQRVVAGPDVALCMTTWTMRGRQPDGDWYAESGESTDVVRRTDSGAWLLAVDIPRGVVAP